MRLLCGIDFFYAWALTTFPIPSTPADKVETAATPHGQDGEGRSVVYCDDSMNICEGGSR